MASTSRGPAELIRDDPGWWYLGYFDTSTRWLRVWREAPGRLVAVVTERPDDPGTSITNAAEMVTAQLEVEYPDAVLDVIEHYTAEPALGAAGEEHFDRVIIREGEEPTWQRIPTDELVGRLGPELLDPGIGPASSSDGPAGDARA